MLLLHIYTSFSTTELTAVAYTLPRFAVFTLCIFSQLLFRKGTLRIIDGVMELPQILVVEAKQLAAPATSPCLDTMMAAKVGTVKIRKVLSEKDY